MNVRRWSLPSTELLATSLSRSETMMVSGKLVLFSSLKYLVSSWK